MLECEMFDGKPIEKKTYNNNKNNHFNPNNDNNNNNNINTSDDNLITYAGSEENILSLDNYNNFDLKLSVKTHQISRSIGDLLNNQNQN
jgi:hypothetical protein